MRGAGLGWVQSPLVGRWSGQSRIGVVGTPSGIREKAARITRGPRRSSSFLSNLQVRRRPAALQRRIADFHV